MRRSFWLAAACIALLLVTPAEAHELTKKRAKEALGPIATEIAPQVAPKIAAMLPGATIGQTSVGECKVKKKGHRVDCLIAFKINGATTGDDTVCFMPAGVEFRGKRSNALKISVRRSQLGCLFLAPLESTPG